MSIFLGPFGPTLGQRGLGPCPLWPCPCGPVKECARADVPLATYGSEYTLRPPPRPASLTKLFARLPCEIVVDRHAGGMILAVKPLQPTLLAAAAALRQHALTWQVDGVVRPFVLFRR